MKPQFRFLVIAVFVIHFAFALLFNAIIPPERGPDETHHYAYVKHLVNLKSLPILPNATATRDARTGAITIHPPLYYSLLAIPYAALQALPDTTIQHVLRFSATILGTTTLWLIFLLARETFPEQKLTQIAILAFAAFLPHFLLLSSVINNDGLMICLSTLLLLWLLRLVRDGSKRGDFLRLGVLYGLLLMTKGSALAFAPLGFFIAWWDWNKHGRGLRTSLLHATLFYALALGIGCWWYVRFYFMVGRFMPIPILPQYESLLLKSPLELTLPDLALPLAGRFVAGAMRSLWSQVDWFLSPTQRDAMGLHAASFWEAIWGQTLSDQPGMFLTTLWLYRLFFLLAIGAVVGCGVLLLRRRTKAVSPEDSQSNSLGWMALFFGLLYFALFHYTLFTHPGGYEGGRYLLPAIGAYATLFVIGWRSLLSGLPPRAGTLFFGGVALLLLLWDIGCAINLVAVLNPLYAS